MPATPDARPVCIVLGLETQIGLNVVRELGRAGVTVIGIAQEAGAIGLASRHLARGIVVDEPRSEQLMATLRTLGEEYGPCCLMAVSEVNLNWLSANLGAFGQVRPLVPPAEAMRVVLDKQRTLAEAQKLGITVPQSLEPQSFDEVEAIAQSFRFPAVLKWKDPNAIASQLSQAGLALLKAEYVYSAQEYLDACRRYLPLGRWPLVQQYCAGYGLGQFFYMHQGQAVRRFQHKRIAEWPPEGGFSSVCDAVGLEQHQALQEQSIALLRAIGWEGVAMVEYRLDPASGEAALMEINGRLWGSFPLAVHSGVGFALISYCLNSGLGLPPLPAPRTDLRCRMVATELKRLVRIWLRPGLILDKSFKVRPLAELWRFLADFLRSNVRYYVWSWSDPRPFFADLANLLRKRGG